MLKYIHLSALFFIILSTQAQYPPPAGQPGSTALHADSAQFVDWASNCYLFNSYMNIADTALGKVYHGSEHDVTGVADNIVVSLGDGGSAVVTFNYAIFNGLGPDFAVFENAFTDNYLELAHVEVSSDGTNYFRFPSVSLTDTLIQTGSFGISDATKIHNLAGKYRAYYGTPFDLQDLSGHAALDINNVTHIRIIDVVGSVDDQYCSRDASGRIVNDPWPTAFESGGFDLDAIGVLNSKCNGIPSTELTNLKLYPTPVIDQLTIELANNEISLIILYDLSGKVIIKQNVNSMKVQMGLSNLKAGIYSLKIICKEYIDCHKIIKVNN